MSGVQLRLGFDEPSAHVTVLLKSSGLRVVVEVHHGSGNDAYAYLTSAGLQPEMTTANGITFPLSRFKEISHLSSNVTAIADPILQPLLDWVENPPDDALAAELELGPDNGLWLTWLCNGQPRSEYLNAASATAILYADIPFVAAPEPLAVMRSCSHLPIMVARCRAHRSGYIEIETAKPQLLEMQNLPGLFRIDDTTYGIPFAAAGALEGKMGFVWEGPLPQLESGPRQLPPMPAKLSMHVTEDLRRLVDSLAAYRTQVVAWESGLGRRVFVIAAIEALDAFPAVVVARPSRVWQWWRNAGLFGKTRGVDAEDADLRVITYEEFVANPTIAYTCQTLIFDDVASSDADTPEVAAAAVSIGGLVDAYLIGITDKLPDDPRQLAGVMARLRPAEFATNSTLPDRYGMDFARGLRQHASAYLSSRRSHNDSASSGLTGNPGPGTDTDPRPTGAPSPETAMFNHTQVLELTVGDELRRDLDGLLVPGLAHEQWREQARLLLSAGSQYTLSPKIAVALGMAEEALASGRRCAVVTAYNRTASMLAMLLRHHQPEVVRNGSIVPRQGRLGIVEGMHALPELQWYDDVIVMDYPDSYAILDAAIGAPDADYAPSRVTLLHATGTVDDELSMAAARSEERETLDSAKLRQPDTVDISRVFDADFTTESAVSPSTMTAAELADQVPPAPVSPRPSVVASQVDRLTLKPILGPNQWAYSEDYDSDDSARPTRRQRRPQPPEDPARR